MFDIAYTAGQWWIIKKGDDSIFYGPYNYQSEAAQAAEDMNIAVTKEQFDMECNLR